MNEKVRGLRDRSDYTLMRWAVLEDTYTWKDRTTYQQSDWFLFQEAVKDHQKQSFAVLLESNLKGLDLPNW